MKELKSYDPGAKCPKRGHDKVETIHLAPKEFVTFPAFGFAYGDSRPECLGRRCERCGAEWSEKVIK